MNILRAGRIAGGAVLLLIGACTSSEVNGPTDNPDVAIVSVKLASPSFGAGNDFGEDHPDADLIATLLDSRGNLISDRSVTWELQQIEGNDPPDTIAALMPTGARTATVIARRNGAVAVVASVVGADGVPRSGTLYLALAP